MDNQTPQDPESGSKMLRALARVGLIRILEKARSAIKEDDQQHFGPALVDPRANLNISIRTWGTSSA
jgi:hypothetical protein